ncbi:flagellar assembly protein FliH [Microbulbifer thermotolerans]|uniref:Flagellar assembly protein FliH n=1 Tax=Microbulbifer thermotolerans TaxID=252514 RepID=A0AB35HXH5_MICTH|nr:flagellar assembly protein FliH [Microbulbifer thermotolerans]MCX2780122.1 flagellar assembly protein FliH [Microbulbifer thermotolerans]MCX2802149.1 flagellar assembly protein FliH [Microbulbifer thermotolerans]MCX2805546.1 flagellar assembly protein FliH [Microbulbifer thermotolerans]MCX2831926.1 flagellar assembly protein FliH [Microbulbifer thermotolerans]MCX2842509.1 flagellar assembly protein FliH [Microbulbifer thermotolerans]
MSEAISWRAWRMGELDGENERERAAERRAELRAQLEAVREEARREGWQAGFDAGREEGLAKGLEEGRRAGEAESERQRRELLQPLAGLAQAFSDALARRDEEIAADLAELAVAVGRQLAGDALEARPQQVVEVVRHLMREEPLFNGGSRLWLHPQDLPLVEAELERELAASGWQTRPDPRLSRGGCRVTGPSGELDASLETRWQQLQERVYKHLRGTADRGETPQ